MTDKIRSEKDAKTKAPRELKPEELEKVAGGLLGDDIGVPRSGKGSSTGGGNNLSGTDLGSGR